VRYCNDRLEPTAPADAVPGSRINVASRWFKRAVQKSAEQVYGAERWLKEQPGRLFMDAKCTEPFPLALPRPEDARVRRIVVVLNAE
jgi:hypothetical protein